MTETRRTVSLIVAVLIVFSSFVVSASAAPGVKVLPGDTENGLVIEAVPTKEVYNYNDTAEIIIKVTNKYGFDIDKLMISAFSGDCKLPRGESCKSGVVKLSKDGSGSSTSFTFRAKLGSGAKLSFFKKILFFFGNLFSRNETFKKLSDEEKSAVSLNSENEIFENRSQISIKFDGVDCSFDISVVYDCGLSENDQKNVDEVDKTLEETIESTEYNTAAKTDSVKGEDTVDEKKKIIDKELKKLEDKDIISNPEYDSNEDAYWFEYKLDSGENIIGGVRLKQGNTEKNAGSSHFMTLEGFGKSVEYQSLINDYQKYYGVSITNAEYESCRNLEGLYFLCFSCHGNVYLNNTPYIQLPGYSDGDMFKADLKEKNTGRIIDAVIDYVDGKISAVSAEKYGVLFPSFFKSKKIDNSVVFLESCCAFGKEKYSEALAKAFIDAGAKAVIGFKGDVFSNYSRDFMKEFVSCFAGGQTIKQAFDNCTYKYGKTDGDEGTVNLLAGKNAGNATILDCGPDGGNIAGLKLKFVDYEGNEIYSKIVIVENGTVLKIEDIGTIAQTVGDWEICNVREKVDYTAVKGEFTEFTINAFNN